MNITEQVLSAFQVEYREHLEGIRKLLTRPDGGSNGWDRERIDQAFRLAHSLKGGARVCDLHPVEELGHRLEAVFERIRNGALHPDEETATTIALALDAVEDWMSLRRCNAAPPAPRAALEAIERLLNPLDANAAATPAPIASTPQRLLVAFQAEYPSYLTALRQLASSADDDARTDDWQEGYRLAHNLRASAEAAELAVPADMCGELEAMLGELCERNVAPDAETRERLQSRLAAVERELRALPVLAASPADRNVAAPRISAATDDGRKAIPPSPHESDPPPKLAVADTVRIGTSSLDALLRSSRQMLTECLGQERVGRELDEIHRQIADMQREHETFRLATIADLRRMEFLPEGNRIARYFENVDRDIRVLARRSRQICALHKRTSRSLQAGARRIEQDVAQTRMVPAETVYQGFRKLVRDLAREEGKQIDFRIVGFDLRADRMVFQALKDPLIHMLRNCVVHGIETPDRRREAGKDATGRIELNFETTGNRLTVEVADDGRGLDRERIYRRAVADGVLPSNDRGETMPDVLDDLIFRPGFSTSEKLTEIAGRGMGLSVVRETVSRLQGEIQIVRNDAPGAKFRITVPLCVSAHRLLLVSSAEHTYALPVQGVERLMRIPQADRETIESKPFVTFDGRPIALVDLGERLGVRRCRTADEQPSPWVVVLKTGTRRIAVGVDALSAEQDLLIHDLDAYAANRRYLGAVLLEDGRCAAVLNPAELAGAPSADVPQPDVGDARPRRTKRTPHVLVVDDSFTTRTLEKCILEANGFQVGVAVDGVEGLAHLHRERYDLVITDVEMPRMDGFALLAAIKQDDRLAATPVVLVTSRDRREDQEKGLELGADAYIVKQKFDHQTWLSAIRDIVEA